MNIFYIEDNQNDANLVRRYTQSSGHTLTVVSDVNQIEDLFNDTFNIVLIDVLLDQQRIGYQIANDFRSHGYDGGMVAVTALNTPQDIAECQQAGFDAVLTKPYEITELEQIINTFS